ncbi:MAG: hypothetical protein U1C74_05730, partial [Phenylobacterium sp.]|nr:hypothetical protein [Phenylobacterium sp.]
MRCGVLALAAFAIFVSAPSTRAADLSPARWPEARRVDLLARESTPWPKAPREAQGAVLVTGSASPVAIEAGLEALRQG